MPSYTCVFTFLLVFVVAETCESQGMRDIFNNNASKFCRFRDDTPFAGLYPRSAWNAITGFGCYYFYDDETRLNFRYNPKKAVIIDGASVPVFEAKDGTTLFFDTQNETTLEHMRPSFKNTYLFNLWISCGRQAIECCDNFMTDNIYPSEEYPCPAIWDAFSCFPPTKAGDITKLTCSDQVSSSDAKICELQSEKECFANGTWRAKTNYATCSIAPVYRDRHTFHVIFLAVAACIALPSVIIFLSFRKFRMNLRIILHRNLIFVIIVRNILTIMTKEIIILDSLKSQNETNHVMDNNDVSCRILAFFEATAKNGMYACMLADGFYLHKLIVRSFADEPNKYILYGVVAGISLIPAIIWGTLRGVHNGDNCWMVDDSNDQWVLDSFRIAVLVINTLLLLDIIRVMIMKIRKSDTATHAKATFRATLFLIPLFGIHIIVISNRGIVTSNTCYAEDIYYYLSYTLEAFQGIAVSILFCYLNAEVHAEFSNAFRKLAIYFQQKYGWQMRGKAPARRRTTAATYVENDL